jgi:hypothetical protein
MPAQVRPPQSAPRNNSRKTSLQQKSRLRAAFLLCPPRMSARICFACGAPPNRRAGRIWKRRPRRPAENKYWSRGHTWSGSPIHVRQFTCPNSRVLSGDVQGGSFLRKKPLDIVPSVYSNWRIAICDLPCFFFLGASTYALAPPGSVGSPAPGAAAIIATGRLSTAGSIFADRVG